eukprot:1058563-Rhodomonas_salina.1
MALPPLRASIDASLSCRVVSHPLLTLCSVVVACETEEEREEPKGNTVLLRKSTRVMINLSFLPRRRMILPDPRTWDEAMNSPDWKDWIEASHAERRNLKKHGVYSVLSKDEREKNNMKATFVGGRQTRGLILKEPGDTCQFNFSDASVKAGLKMLAEAKEAAGAKSLRRGGKGGRVLN